jgi:hypothetical protein
MKTFEDLRAWQRSIDLADMIHRISASFPKSEFFWNDGTGSRRSELRSVQHRGGALCMRFGYISPEECASFEKQAAKVGQDLNGLINYVKNKAEKKR